MALRLTPPTKFASPAPFSSRRATTSLFYVAATNNRQQQRQKGGKSPMRSPLHTAEEIASRFGLETTIADLERLFREAGGDPPVIPGESPGRRPVRVAYQGTRGSYCQEAAERAFPSVSCDSFACANMEDAFTALEDRSADRAIIPAENSIDGPIYRNIDLLLRHKDITIVNELVLPVDHCLISLRDTKLASIRRVVSHPQAISHCRGRLEALSVDIDEVSCPAQAAQYLAESRVGDTAVIGSKAAAKEFGLQVIEHSFQDPAVNFNRYFQLGLGSGSGQTRPAAGTQKTTVAFALDNGVSDLFRAMWVFETRGVKVLRVDHRPDKSNPIRMRKEGSEKNACFNYVFVMDLEGNGSDPKVKRALTGLEEIAGFVRVLGSYTSTCK